jgi:hypothetical protein
MMRDVALLGARLLGGYMGIHASQKLLGKFHGPGFDSADAMFEKAGLSPGKPMAAAPAGDGPRTGTRACRRARA